MAQSRPMPTSVVAANGLLQQKSDCETFVSAHSAAAPRSTDVDARADINEAMTSAGAECERGCAEHVHDDQSLQRAWFMIPACWTWLTCSYLPLGGAATKGRAVLVTEHWLHRVRGRRGRQRLSEQHGMVAGRRWPSSGLGCCLRTGTRLGCYGDGLAKPWRGAAREGMYAKKTDP